MRLHIALLCAAFIVAVSFACALARDASASSVPSPTLDPITLGQVLTFLLVSLGPFNVIGPFVEMTRGRDAVFKRQLAMQGTLMAALILLVAATLGVKVLRDWNVSAAALLITAGILLFRVGSQVVTRLGKVTEFDTESAVAANTPTVSSLAFAPLAFPTIATPYGIAVLTLAMTLASNGRPERWQILAVAGLVLAVDFLAMLVAERILQRSIFAAAFGIIGAAMGVLQIALSVQAVIAGLRLLGVVMV